MSVRAGGVFVRDLQHAKNLRDAGLLTDADVATARQKLNSRKEDSEPPNLQIQGLGFSDPSPEVGEKVTLRAIAKNVGSSEASGTFNVLGKTLSFSGLGRGENQADSFTFTAKDPGKRVAQAQDETASLNIELEEQDNPDNTEKNTKRLSGGSQKAIRESTSRFNGDSSPAQTTSAETTQSPTEGSDSPADKAKNTARRVAGVGVAGLIAIGLTLFALVDD